jgi:hypothetical protein
VTALAGCTDSGSGGDGDGMDESSMDGTETGAMDGNGTMDDPSMGGNGTTGG